MGFNLFPILILLISMLGIVINPRNHLILRISIFNACALFFLVSQMKGSINEILIFIFATVSVFTAGFYYALIVNERIQD